MHMIQSVYSNVELEVVVERLVSHKKNYLLMTKTKESGEDKKASK